MKILSDMKEFLKMVSSTEWVSNAIKENILLDTSKMEI